MTTEEAIAYWEVFQREIDLLYPLCDERSKATLGEQREPVALALSALRAQQELESNLKVLESNQPLTMDELREMEGEPVWIVFGECGDWRVPDFIDIGAYRGFIRFTDKSAEPLADYGKDWLAYRHKPEPHTSTCTATNQPCSMCQPGPCESRREVASELYVHHNPMQ